VEHSDHHHNKKKKTMPCNHNRYNNHTTEISIGKQSDIPTHFSNKPFQPPVTAMASINQFQKQPRFTTHQMGQGVMLVFISQPPSS